MRMMSRVTITFVVLLGVLIGSVPPTTADDIPARDDFLLNLEFTLPSAPCVRLLTANGSIGCSTPRGFTQDPIHPLHTATDLDAFLLGSSPSPSSSVILLMSPTLFNESTLRVLINPTDPSHPHPTVRGIILTGPPPTTAAGGFTVSSPAPANLNQQYGLFPDDAYAWNPTGTGLSMLDFGIPIVVLDDSSTELIDDVIQKKATPVNFNASSKTYGTSNSKYPLVSAKMKYPMWSDAESNRTSKSCLTDGNCLPLGGYSIWSSFEEVITGVGHDYILFITQMDSSAFFHERAYGAGSSGTSTIALLAAVQALQTLQIDFSTTNYQLIFAFFNGEAWGYIGSQRFTQDIHGFTCKKPGVLHNEIPYCQAPYRASLAFTSLDPSRIRAIYDLSLMDSIDRPLSDPPSSIHPRKQFFLHRDPSSATPATTDALITRILNDRAADPWTVTSGVSVSAATSSPATATSMPPTPVQSFLRWNRSLPAVQVTTFDRAIDNPGFYSHYDTEYSVEGACLAGTLIARLAYASMFDASAAAPSPPESLQADCGFVADLVGCFSESIGCDLVRSLVPAIPVDAGRPSFYTGIYSPLTPIDPVPAAVYALMVRSTAVGEVAGNCSSCASFGQVCLNGRCYSTTTYYHETYSPAFELNTDTNRFEIVNSSSWMSQWTESYWDDGLATKVFLVDSLGIELSRFFTGIGFLAISTVFVLTLEFFFNKHKKD